MHDQQDLSLDIEEGSGMDMEIPGWLRRHFGEFSGQINSSPSGEERYYDRMLHAFLLPSSNSVGHLSYQPSSHNSVDNNFFSALMEFSKQLDYFSDNPKFLLYRKTESSLTAYVTISILFTGLFVQAYSLTAGRDNAIKGALAQCTILTASIAMLVGWVLTALNCSHRLNLFHLNQQLRRKYFRSAPDNETIYQLLSNALEPLWVVVLWAALDLMMANSVFHQQDCNGDRDSDSCYYSTVLAVQAMLVVIGLPTCLFISIKSTRLPTMLLMLLLSKEMQNNELRHIIGNVAHDLKTPLSSFISGVEAIVSVTQEIEAICRKDMRNSHSNEEVIDRLDAISEISEHMTKINCFMLMIINRCLDSSQSLQGLELRPRLSSTTITYCIEQPLSCLTMHDEQAAVQVEFLPTDLGDKEVITDVQWLQDNLLCLLSNAIKYSRLAGHAARRDVDLRISLVDKDKLPTSLEAHASEDSLRKIEKKRRKSWLNCDNKRTKPSLLKASIQHQRNGRVAPSAHNVNDSDSSLLDDIPSLPNNSSDSIEQTEKFICFEVLDSGEIIRDNRQLRSVFSPKPASSRYSGGTGLGLYSLEKRMEALGGKCGARKREDRDHGCVFWFAIPLHLALAGLCPAPGQTILSQPTESAKQKLDHPEQTQEQQLQQVANNPQFNIKNADFFGVYGHRRSSLRASSSSSTSRKSQTRSGHRPSTSSGDPPCVVNHNRPSFSLPTQHEETDSAISTQKSTPVASNVGLPPLRILIVDDSPVVLKMTSLLLTRQKHIVTVAADGVRALQIVEEQLTAYKERITQSKDKDVWTVPPLFDVILMDLQMPILSGAETAIKIRSMESDLNSEILRHFQTASDQILPFDGQSVSDLEVKFKIIGFSAKGDELALHEAFSGGMDAFIHKPFTIQAFSDAYMHSIHSNSHPQSSSNGCTTMCTHHVCSPCSPALQFKWAVPSNLLLEMCLPRVWPLTDVDCVFSARILWFKCFDFHYEDKV
eukprot:scaffold7649_cov165-Ochromonas_danica.AAC.7